MRILHIVTFFLGTALASDDPLSVCEALNRREALDQRVIAITGIQVATGEGSWLVADCGTPVAADGSSSPRNSIWIEMSSHRRQGVGFGSKQLETSVKRINSE